jgi:hypothetical protein
VIHYHGDPQGACDDAEIPGAGGRPDGRYAALMAVIWTVGATCLLAGCGFSPPLSPADRTTLLACRSDADRVYDVRNRAQISERGGEDSPFSGESQRGSPSDGLADRYAHERTVDDCVRHGGADQTIH